MPPLATTVSDKKKVFSVSGNPPQAIVSAVHIFNCLWQKQSVPESWKTQCVIPILKPNKDTFDRNSYRSISLASCLGKIFEQIMKLLLDYFERKGKSSCQQTRISWGLHLICPTMQTCSCKIKNFFDQLSLGQHSSW